MAIRSAVREKLLVQASARPWWCRRSSRPRTTGRHSNAFHAWLGAGSGALAVQMVRNAMTIRQTPQTTRDHQTNNGQPAPCAHSPRSVASARRAAQRQSNQTVLERTVPNVPERMWPRTNTTDYAAPKCRARCVAVRPPFPTPLRVHNTCFAPRDDRALHRVHRALVFVLDHNGVCCGSCCRRPFAGPPGTQRLHFVGHTD